MLTAINLTALTWILIFLAALLVLWAGGSIRLNQYRSFSFHPRPRTVRNVLFFRASAWQLTWEKHPRFILRRIPYKWIAVEVMMTLTFFILGVRDALSRRYRRRSLRG